MCQTIFVDQQITKNVPFLLITKEDNEIEQEVLKAIEQRREPAREIARRMKQNPREEKPMMETQEDGQQAMEDALTAWNNAMMPLQLALENMANLLSCLIQEENEMAVEREESQAKERQVETLTLLPGFTKISRWFLDCNLVIGPPVFSNKKLP